MTGSKGRGADAVARTLAAAGVQRIFTLSGNHVMPVFDAALDARIELIHVRHEAAAVHMADAWARLTGEVGVALVTGGPGHANALGALYTAAMAESPVLLLSGHAPLAQLGRGAFQEMRQAEAAVPLTKAAWTAQRADTLAADIAQAMATARAGRAGPVHVSLPQDVLEGAMDDGAPVDAPADAAGPTLSREALAPFVERLRRAARPLVLCGPACMTREGRQAMGALEEASGVPVIGMESPRGVADPALGAFAEILPRADCVLLLGKRLDFTLKFGAVPPFAPACELMQVDPEMDEIERTRRAVGARLSAHAIGGARDALEAFALQGCVQRSSWRAEVADALRFRPAAWDDARSTQPGRLHPVQALRPLQELLDAHPDSVFVSDGGEIGQWAQACLRAPHRVINGVAGSIGAALPFALSARLAHPGAPVIAVMGDGTFGFHCAELDTAVRYGLPFVAVVGNDARWNAEYQIQLRDYGADRLVGCELLPARYDRVAEGFGGAGELVTRAEELLPAARRALQSARPAVLNVMIEGLAAPTVRR